MTRKIYQVWTEDSEGEESILFTGSKTAAYQYYNQHGSAKAGLHIGYLL